MRIISGDLKGRRLKNLKGYHVRPTADKVKEAVFSMLNAKVYSARVLDLFAGTGSLAIEALSRGAGSAVMVEASRQGVQVIRDNLRLLEAPARDFVPGTARVVQDDALRFVRCYAGECFDLVFMDPPYYAGMPEAVIPELKGKLSPAGVIVVETAKDEKFVAEPFELRVVRVYGGSKVWLLQNP